MTVAIIENAEMCFKTMYINLSLQRMLTGTLLACTSYVLSNVFIHMYVSIVVCIWTSIHTWMCYNHFVSCYLSLEFYLFNASHVF